MKSTLPLRCVSVNGFSLHANTHIPAHHRDQGPQPPAAGGVRPHAAAKTRLICLDVPRRCPGAQEETDESRLWGKE